MLSPRPLRAARKRSGLVSKLGDHSTFCIRSQIQWLSLGCESPVCRGCPQAWIAASAFVLRLRRVAPPTVSSDETLTKIAELFTCVATGRLEQRPS